MKIKFIILSLLLIAMFAVSCYDDKGSYKYDKLNDIKIEFNDSQKLLVFGDTLIINPHFKFAVDSTEAHLKYAWDICGKVISEERNLFHVLDTTGALSITLRVTDTETNLIYFGEFFKDVAAIYDRIGWMILSEKNNKSCLSYLRDDRKEVEKDKWVYTCVEFPNVYENVNQESLGAHPVKFLEHFCDMITNVDKGQYWIIQQGGVGCVDLVGATFRKDAELNNFFWNNDIPANFAPVEMCDMKWITMVTSSDGKVYSRKKTTPVLYNSGYFINKALMFKDEKGNEYPIDGRRFILAPIGSVHYTMLYDATHKRFFAIDDRYEQSAGRVTAPFVDEKLYDKNSNFARLDNLGDCELIYTGAYEVDYTGVGYYSVLKKDGSYYIHDFIAGGIDDELDAPHVEYVSQKGCPEFQSVIKDNSVFWLCRQAPYLMVSSGKELWLYKRTVDGVGEVVFSKYYTFPSEIVAMNADIYGSRKLGVGLKDGTFFVMDLSTNVVDKGKDEDKLLFKSEHNYGDIKFLRYKTLGNGWSWGSVWPDELED